MRKTKLEKGITLVALIITIVVLLILAVVSIGAVRNSGIIGHATNTSDAWKQAEKNETTDLQGYEDLLKENIWKSGIWGKRGLAPVTLDTAYVVYLGEIAYEITIKSDGSITISAGDSIIKIFKEDIDEGLLNKTASVSSTKISYNGNYNIKTEDEGEATGKIDTEFEFVDDGRSINWSMDGSFTGTCNIILDSYLYYALEARETNSDNLGAILLEKNYSGTVLLMGNERHGDARYTTTFMLCDWWKYTKKGWNSRIL